MVEISDFAMEHVFNKIVTEEGDVIYWRDCVLRNDMVHGEQGYVIVFSNGDCHHTYHYPPNCIR
jgi:hypothetical protein